MCYTVYLTALCSLQTVSRMFLSILYSIEDVIRMILELILSYIFVFLQCCSLCPYYLSYCCAWRCCSSSCYMTTCCYPSHGASLACSFCIIVLLLGIVIIVYALLLEDLVDTIGIKLPDALQHIISKRKGNRTTSNKTILLNDFNDYDASNNGTEELYSSNRHADKGLNLPDFLLNLTPSVNQKFDAFDSLHNIEESSSVFIPIESRVQVTDVINMIIGAENQNNSNKFNVRSLSEQWSTDHVTRYKLFHKDIYTDSKLLEILSKKPEQLR